MNLVVLHYYRTVCRAGSIAKAAEQLSLSRQALSKSILSLENEVGLRLFTRKSSGIEPTPAGEILCRHAGLLLRGWEDAMEELEPLRREQKALLRVGYGQMAYNLWEAGHAEAFAQAHPEVRFSYEIAPPDQLFLHFEEGKLDLIVSSDFARSKDTFCVLLQRLPHCILLRSDDPLAQAKALCLQDLAGRTIFLNPGHLLSENIRRAFRAMGIEADFRPFPSHDPLTLLHTIRNSRAIYFDSMLRFIYRDLMEGLTTVPFLYEGPFGLASHDIFAIARREQKANPTLRQYISYLADPQSRPRAKERTKVLLP